MVLLLALLLAAGPAAAPKKIAVLDVRAGPKVDAALGPYLTQVLAGEVARRTGTSPLVSADLKALLGFEKTRRNFGCDEEEGTACIAELAGALGADEVINTQLLTSDGPDGKPARYLLTTSRLDAHKATPIARDAQSVVFGDNAALEAAVRRAASQLYPVGAAVADEPPTTKVSAASLPRAPSEATSTAPAPAHRTVTWIAAAGTAALAAGAAITGAAALSSANAGHASARTTAHAADALWVGAALCAGLTAWLWSGDGAPAASSH
jgi:hypothetical protein